MDIKCYALNIHLHILHNLDTWLLTALHLICIIQGGSNMTGTFCV